MKGITKVLIGAIEASLQNDVLRVDKQQQSNAKKVRECYVCTSYYIRLYYFKRRALSEVAYIRRILFNCCLRFVYADRSLGKSHGSRENRSI